MVWQMTSRQRARAGGDDTAPYVGHDDQRPPVGDEWVIEWVCRYL